MIDCSILRYLTDRLRFNKDGRISLALLPDILQLLHHIAARFGILFASIPILRFMDIKMKSI